MRFDAKMMNSIKQAEGLLQGQENPQQENEGGKIADLPPGHPMLTVLEQAKKRHKERMREENMILEERQEVKEKVKVKKGKREQKRQRDRAEEERENKVRDLVKGVNKEIDVVQRSLGNLVGHVCDTQGEVMERPFVVARLKRLERLILAFSKGLSDSKLNSISFEV